mmetsp:Transcript_14639/g.30231  ORF Transcript_14639/g.30231 Transcript_14639/m.30231 type:complete len:86 (-) Transcript_14639:1245-1502(-)
MLRIAIAYNLAPTREGMDWSYYLDQWCDCLWDLLLDFGGLQYLVLGGLYLWDILLYEGLLPSLDAGFHACDVKWIIALAMVAHLN